MAIKHSVSLPQLQQPVVVWKIVIAMWRVGVNHVRGLKWANKYMSVCVQAIDSGHTALRRRSISTLGKLVIVYTCTVRLPLTDDYCCSCHYHMDPGKHKAFWAFQVCAYSATRHSCYGLWNELLVLIVVCAHFYRLLWCHHYFPIALCYGSSGFEKCHHKRFLSTTCTYMQVMMLLLGTTSFLVVHWRQARMERLMAHRIEQQIRA